MKEKSVFIRKYQRNAIYSYVTLVTVQNDFHPSVSTILRVLKENYLDVVFAGSRNKRKGVS
jgi:hypothetical protein